MPWVRLDDHFDQNPKIVSVGPIGLALWVSGLAYCNRNLTDGFIPWAAAKTLIPFEWLTPDKNDDSKEEWVIERLCTTADAGTNGDYVASYIFHPHDAIKLLLSAGLWHEDGLGYRVHDYADFQPTRAEVEAERAAKSAAGKAGAQARAKARAQQELEQNANGTATKLQPVPDPDPVPSASAKQSDPPSVVRPSRKRSEPRSPLTPEKRVELVKEFSAQGLVAVSERIDEALNHKAVDRCKDEYLYVRGWLRRDVERENPQQPAVRKLPYDPEMNGAKLLGRAK